MNKEKLKKEARMDTKELEEAAAKRTEETRGTKGKKGREVKNEVAGAVCVRVKLGVLRAALAAAGAAVSRKPRIEEFGAVRLNFERAAGAMPPMLRIEAADPVVGVSALARVGLCSLTGDAGACCAVNFAKLAAFVKLEDAASEDDGADVDLESAAEILRVRTSADDGAVRELRLRRVPAAEDAQAAREFIPDIIAKDLRFVRLWADGLARALALTLPTADAVRAERASLCAVNFSLVERFGGEALVLEASDGLVLVRASQETRWRGTDGEAASRAWAAADGRLACYAWEAAAFSAAIPRDAAKALRKALSRADGESAAEVSFYSDPAAAEAVKARKTVSVHFPLKVKQEEVPAEATIFVKPSPAAGKFPDVAKAAADCLDLAEADAAGASVNVRAGALSLLAAGALSSHPAAEGFGVSLAADFAAGELEARCDFGDAYRGRVNLEACAGGAELSVEEAELGVFNARLLLRVFGAAAAGGVWRATFGKDLLVAETADGGAEAVAVVMGMRKQR